MRSIRNRNVAVVGGAGFLGSHLVNHLIEDRNCYVLVIDNLHSGRREFIHEKAEFEHHDIVGSENFLRAIFESRKIGYVFNYAAHPYIPLSFQRPRYVAETNFDGAMAVINAAQEAGAEAILQVSSAEIYGEGNRAIEEEDGTAVARINEECRVMPHSTYGLAKAAVDYYVQVGWRERKTPAIALRQFNCVGERETHPYIVPEIISQLGKKWHPGNSTTVKLGNNSFRDFLYAGDQAKIAVELLERGQFGEVYNLGSETGIKMYDLAKLIGKLMGFESVTVQQDVSRVRPWEIWHLQSDNSKIWEAIDPTNDTPRSELVPLEEALKRTIAYYHENNNQWCWEKGK